MGYSGSWYDWTPRPTVGERKRKAEKQIAKLQKSGRVLAPVLIEGRTIARTFWGKAWCENLERYSDIANRLERGRSYVRSGSVIDLRIDQGTVDALVQGSELYRVHVTVEPVESKQYRAIIGECAGKIDSLIELLQGKLSGAVMEVITRKETGLFPAPRQIGLACTCPDSARMCKHVAAVLYGIGARFDQEPELLFRLRGADPAELVSHAAAGAIAGPREVAKEKTLGGDLADVFGIELDLGKGEERAVKTPAAKKRHAKAAPPATITGAELTALGVPPATVQSWLKTGVLGRTETRGVYQRTPETEVRIERHRARRARA
jgi:uncharacterized Zn finger protein